MSWDDARFERFVEATIRMARHQLPGYGRPHVILPYPPKEELTCIAAVRNLPSRLEANGLVAESVAMAPYVARAVQRYARRPLEDSDEFVRQRLRPLSSHPLFVAWLRTNGLVRNFVVVVENTARGLTPSKHLRVLKPAGTFRAVKRGNQVLIDPRNYDRFSRIADLAASIDPGAAAKIYGGFKPLLQTAYDELGNQEPIDRAMERAIVGLLQAPVVDGDVRVQMAGEGIGYQFSDAKLEALTGAQKQLVRMGPRNMRVIQDRLRLFGLALGIPAQRLSRF